MIQKNLQTAIFVRFYLTGGGISKVIQNQNNECKHSRMQGSFEPPLQAVTAGNAPFTE